MLDTLRERDGRPVSELAQVLPELGRHAVLKHLRVLTDAELVTTAKVGRQRIVHLNPTPLIQLAEEWLDDYTAAAGLALSRLQRHLQDSPTAHHHNLFPGDTMSTTKDITATVVIEATPDRVWQAITDPTQTAHWFFGGAVNSSWQVGDPIAWLDPEGDTLIEGTIEAIEPGVRLAHTFHTLWSPQTAADPASHYEWLLEPMGPLTRLTIRHTGVPVGTATADQVEGGNSLILSAAKTFVESGRSMAGMAGTSAT